MKNYQITEWVHHFIEEQVREGDICIDATMGNGHDTSFMAKLVGQTGKIYAFDVQEIALKNTKEKLKKDNVLDRCELILDSHENMENYIKRETVSCSVFNFGYLPGGDHKKATKADTSVRAIEKGLDLLKKKGMMTLCIYSGGDTGFEERDAILDYIRNLDAKKYLVIETQYINRQNHPPIPVLIIKL
ncbi:MAG: class I SAM-dependent methyltransferase [Lachnospiraceae bacterium]